MHLGNAWTAYLAWLQVRKAKGTMVFRIEDLDPERSRADYIKDAMFDLSWLGLDWDEGPDIGGAFGPYCQDARRSLYQAALEKLQRKGLIYPCYCTRAELAATAPHGTHGERIYPGTCRSRMAEDRPAALRLRAECGEISFVDGLRGRKKQDIAGEVGDFVVRRADGVHAYQLAVVVDDAAMNITHVLRGDDLIDSTPRQLLLYQLLGLSAPAFYHVPLLVGEDGHRLSKRHGDLSLVYLRQNGVRPEKIIGYLAWKARMLDTWQSVSARETVDLFEQAKIPVTPIIAAYQDWQMR
jgi:glutamyl-tRNA synthetase